MSKQYKFYPLGYIFSDQKLNKIPEHYREEIIIEKFYYCLDEEMESHIVEDGNRFIVIHGEFVHVGIEDQFSEEQLLAKLLHAYSENHDYFLDTLDFIAGRYVIIIGNESKVEVYPDAANTRTTYFTTDRNVLSSHAFLINDHFNYDRVKFIKSLPTLTNGLLYTPFENIKSLVPNYLLNLFSKKLTRFFPREDNKYTSYSENYRFTLIEHFWKKQLEYYFSKYQNFVFSLTGGGDSKFSLSLMKEYMNKVQFFTYSTIRGEDNSSETGRLLSLDYQIVKQILKDINLKHKFIYIDEDRKALSKEEDILLIKNTIGRHSDFLIPHIKTLYPQENLKHIRGNLLEIGKARYFSAYKESSIDEVKQIFDAQYKKTSNDKEIQLVNQSFNDYVLNLNYGKDVFNYHLLDLYHWEVRMGRWHSEILNTHDIVFDTISPFNHRAMIDISLSFPYEKRKNEYMFQEIINRNFPILNFYGQNNVLNLYEQLRNTRYNK